MVTQDTTRPDARVDTNVRGDRGWTTVSAIGLTLVGTTCCALPIVLVALGAGGAVASLASAAPWLVALSQYKAWTFSATGLMLSVAWWQAYRLTIHSTECSIEDARRLRLQKWALALSSAIFAVSVFAAYALLPITVWLEGSG